MPSLEKQDNENDTGNAVTLRITEEGVIAPDIYSELSENERREAIANLRRYFEIAFVIADEQLRRDTDLTERGSIPTMKERSSENLKI